MDAVLRQERKRERGVLIGGKHDESCSGGAPPQEGFSTHFPSLPIGGLPSATLHEEFEDAMDKPFLFLAYHGRNTLANVFFIAKTQIVHDTP